MMLSDLDTSARTLLAVVADAAVRAFVLACLMGIAIVMLRRMRASVRLTAWTVVLCAALALPVLGLALPGWSWRLPTASLLDAWVPTGPPAIGRQALATVGAVAIEPAPVRSWPSAPVVAAAIYLAGVLLLAVYACLAWFAARRLRLSAQPIADAHALARLARHAAAAGLTTAPRLVESADLLVPVTTSVRRPIVALPADWRDWRAGKLDAVLIHEVAHVARRDALTQRVSLCYRAAFWFSPLSWWLHRRLSDLADQASDEAALEAGIDPATYAGALLDFFTQLQNGARRAEWHVAMARRADADAAQRVERILSWKGGPIMKHSTSLMAGIVLATVPVVALTASVRVTSDAGSAFTTARAAIDRAPEVRAPEIVPPVVTPATPRTPEIATESPTHTVGAPQEPVTSPSGLLRPTTVISKSITLGLTTTTTPEPPIRSRLEEISHLFTSQAQTDDFAKGAYEVGAPGLVLPKMLTSVKPRYTPDAMRAKIQGSISVEIIILPDGTVGKARVQRLPDGASSFVWRADGTALDPAAVAGQLVEEALIAARQWTFTPGILNGQPVSVHTTLVLEFRLH